MLDTVLWLIGNPILGAFSGFFFGRAVVMTIEGFFL